MLSNSNFSFLKAIASATLVLSTLYAGSASADLDNPVMGSGFANVFAGTSADCGGGYCFGSGWGVGDLKATVNGNEVILQPNFNTYNDAATPGDIAYWRNGALGNKVFQANLYEEIGTTPIGTGTYTFSGYVDSDSLDAGYSKVAFIKVLDSLGGFADVLGATTALSVGAFSVSGDLTPYEGDAQYILQVGFTVQGLNANPADEAALGSVGLRIGASSAASSAAVDPTGIPVLPLWALFGLAGLIGLMGLRRKA